jgi:hypothetical protein
MTAPEPKLLPGNADLSHLTKQASELKDALAGADREALDRLETFHPDPPSAPFSLSDARLTIANEYGFKSWNDLVTAVGEQMVEQRDLHRWFGVQLNNGAWTMISDPSFSEEASVEEREDALYSAYASAYHWRQSGNEANCARAEHLISRMAAKIGQPALAKAHAVRCLELVEGHPEAMADWDAPFGYEALARALAGLGEDSGARKALLTARRLTAEISGEGDRAILEAELVAEPWFGLTL